MYLNNCGQFNLIIDIDMPQFFHVLRCYKCFVFQVHQTKKSNKWACKLCGEKQSIKRNYGMGTAKECRSHVQRLNGIRGEIEESKAALDDEVSSSPPITEDDYDKVEIRKKTPSKWSNYVNEDEELTESLTDDTVYGVDTVPNIPKKRKKHNSWKTPYNNSNLDLEHVSNNSCDTGAFSKRDWGNTHKHVTALSDNLFCNAEDKTRKNIQISSKSSELKIEQKIPSKWEQFVDDAELEENEGNLKETVLEVQSNIGTLFSLSEDQDIDDLLNF